MCKYLYVLQFALCKLCWFGSFRFVGVAVNNFICFRCPLASHYWRSLLLLLLLLFSVENFVKDLYDSSNIIIKSRQKEKNGKHDKCKHAHAHALVIPLAFACCVLNLPSAALRFHRLCDCDRARTFSVLSGSLYMYIFQ